MDALVVGTAGHIDHGKTALVRALTGIDTDRLAVEKQRGITTELGFAHVDLDGHRLAVVDVPGHERFIKSMVAGATGLDLVMLVIAADEGVMPQTREHLDVCQLLGVRAGLVVLTKRDLVDDEWLALLDGELTTFLAGSFLAGAPRLAVSAKTGAGLDELRRALATAAATLPPRPATGVLRLPLDRVFSLKGFGTVVTGTIAGGRIAVGDELVVWPRRLATRVRTLQVHGAAVERAQAGQRCAVNLAGLAVDDLARGDVLSHPGALEPSHLLDVRLRHVAAARAPLPARSKVLLHHGTTQVLATLALVDADELAPGGEAFAQLRLDRATPVAALPGDRFIVRGFQPLADHGTTVGGGEVIRVHAPRARADDHAAVVARLAAARTRDRLALEVHTAHAAAPTAADLGRRLGLPPAELAAILDELTGEGALLRAGDGDGAVYLHADTVAALERQLTNLVDDAARATPPRDLPREEARQKLPAALPVRAFDALAAALIRRGALEQAGEHLRRRAAAAAAAPAAALSPLEADLAARFRGWALEPPRPREVAAAIGRPEAQVKPALDKLLAARVLTKVKPDYYVDAGALAALEARLRAYLAAHREISPQAWKDLTGTSRKYSIPLAEHFDERKVTLRVGDQRRLR